MNAFYLFVILVIVFAILPYAILLFVMKPWMRALTAGHPVPIFELIGMKLRRVSPEVVIGAYIKARSAGIDITRAELERHILAGGNIEKVVGTLIKAHARGIPVPFDVLAKTDLAGFDLDGIDLQEFTKTLAKES